MNILLAEDDKNLGTVMKKELEEESNVVDLVHNGVEAVLHFIERRYDLVLLDIVMPKLDGINALRIMKKLNPDVPAIAISGNAAQNEIEESLKIGVIQYFAKPFQIEELKDYIKNHLRCYR